ncbi:FAD-dependent oxidoreductase [Methylocella sp. CPCC 101449]|uniref:FAD-dependent oxidoreductase n=1 Tax=Methylocella sp. CPCC 101449 TaxID=2987531 RepID=UPI0028901203|nr:FAD-dependent oxidoreductase [Methylocella sp. CPCC 101449]MDT2020898.1 FAD-dependent oxidoreductase [Methylocella sp. CPCC 101449]
MVGSADIVEPSRRTEIFGTFDVVVLGGGPAGIAAAVAAARHGASTLLIERYGFLGGMGTAAGVTNFCGLHANRFGTIDQVVHGIADDLLARIDRLDGLKAPHLVFGKINAQAYDTSAYKIAADALLLEAGAKLLFHALGAGVIMETPRQIGAVLVETKSGRRAVRGRVFIDASGDGDLAAWAGAPFEVGAEDGSIMFPSAMFRINDVDREAARSRAWTSFPALMEAAEQKSGRRFPRKTPIIRPQHHEIEWRANLTQVANADRTPVNGVDAQQLSDGEIAGRRQIAEAFGMLKEAVPAFANAYIVDIAPQLGIRETRRILGDYVLSEEDVLGCASFEDTIGVNGWPIEDHVAGDILLRWPDIPGSRGFNHLPFRMLLPRGLDNLFVVGRCASMTHGGQSAARVSGACFVMGEAAGTAAAIVASGNGTSRAVDIPALQKTLVAQGVYLGTDMP